MLSTLGASMILFPKPGACAEETPSRGVQVLGLGAGLVLGMGTGQGVERRYQENGWFFTVADGTGWGLLLLGFGDCAPSSHCASQNTAHGIGLGLLIASRVGQVGELLFYGAGHGLFSDAPQEPKKAGVSLNFSPSLDGKGLQGLAAYHF